MSKNVSFLANFRSALAERKCHSWKCFSLNGSTCNVACLQAIANYVAIFTVYNYCLQLKVYVQLLGTMELKNTQTNPMRPKQEPMGDWLSG